MNQYITNLYYTRDKEGIFTVYIDIDMYEGNKARYVTNRKATDYIGTYTVFRRQNSRFGYIDKNGDEQFVCEKKLKELIKDEMTLNMIKISDMLVNGFFFKMSVISTRFRDLARLDSYKDIDKICTRYGYSSYNVEQDIYRHTSKGAIQESAKKRIIRHAKEY